MEIVRYLTEAGRRCRGSASGTRTGRSAASRPAPWPSCWRLPLAAFREALSSADRGRGRRRTACWRPSTPSPRCGRPA